MKREAREALARRHGAGATSPGRAQVVVQERAPARTREGVARSAQATVALDVLEQVRRAALVEGPGNVRDLERLAQRPQRLDVAVARVLARTVLADQDRQRAARHADQVLEFALG